MTPQEKIIEIQDIAERARIAADCDELNCKHDFDDRPCPIQYLNRIQLVLHFNGPVSNLPWYDYPKSPQTEAKLTAQVVSDYSCKVVADQLEEIQRRIEEAFFAPSRLFDVVDHQFNGLAPKISTFTPQRFTEKIKLGKDFHLGLDEY